MRRGSSSSFHDDPAQLWLEFAASPPGPGMSPGDGKVPGHRGDAVFFAVQPDAMLAPRIVAFAGKQCGRLGLDGRPRPSGTLHVSINGLGIFSNLSPEDIDKAGRAASTVEMAPFDLTFDRLQSFRGERSRPVVLCCGEGIERLAALREALGAALLRQRLHPGFDARAVLHMTLLYDVRSFPDVVLETPIVMPVCDFVLVRSLYGKGEYKELGRWPLRG